MPIQSDIHQRLSRSADALARAVRKTLDRWLREGVSLQEILVRLSAFRLPPGERQKLERTVRASMEEIAKARALDVPTEHIEALIAARQISIGNIQHQMQADLQQEVRRALVAGYGPDVLRKRLEEREFGNAKTEAYTAVSRFNNLLTFENAAATGTQTFKYFGPVSTITRPFCRAHAGQVFTLDEIAKMDNGQGLSVRESCGGYNCRHYWIPANGQRSTINDQRSTVQIGKQTFLMNDEQKQALFARERSLWIQTPEATAGKGVEWHMAAKPLARAHDGFNETITNTPGEGVWKNYYREDPTTKKRISNFQFHALERMDQNNVQSASEYATRLAAIMRNGSAEVYGLSGNNRELRYVVIDRSARWMAMLDTDGSVHTGHPLQRIEQYVRNKRRLGLLRDFIGDFK